MMHETFGLDPWCDWCEGDIDPLDHWTTDWQTVNTRFCSLECAARHGNAETRPRHVLGLELDRTSLKDLHECGATEIDGTLIVASEGTTSRLQKAERRGVRL